jgi:translation initiation factor IF-2
MGEEFGMQVGGSMSGNKVRVYEVAKQLNLDPKAVVGLFQAIGIAEVRNHMSSVEPEAVERVKRHLEKQRTHDVVEERVRADGRVVKRRAIAKQQPDTTSGPALPAPSSTRLTDDVDVGRPAAPAPDVSARPAPAPSGRMPVTPPSVPALEPNGHGQAEALARESGRLPSTRELPEERRSTRELEPPAAVRADRASARSLLHEEPSAHEPAVLATEAAAAPAPDRAERPAEAAREEQPPSDVPPPSETHPAQQRQSAVPKTGVEYWTGRPGVPMQPPAAARAANAPPAGNMPRRVQYDPRAGTSTGIAGRRDMRVPGQQGGRPMMGRSGPGGRRGSAVPMRKPGGVVSTQEMSAHKKVIRIEENITLQGMAQKMSLKSTELLMKLLGMGMTGVHINTTLDADTAKILASEFGWEVEDLAKSEAENIAAARGEEGQEAVAEADKEITIRPPVVTVMGHVDHGKTSLLDRIRKANVAGGEAGGITQHIGAYRVDTQHGTIVFLDTPGHEAFTQMRARGASVTDLVVLVVAADDGVMPQTKEAINHAKAAKVPIIVAVNKIDKPSADPERVRRELVEFGLQPEDWGGDTIFVNVSAVTGEGIDQLLEMISLQSEVLELKANPRKAASGTVLEALLDRGRGPVARVLVQDGTLRVGDFVLAGAGFGKVRAMTNELGKQVHEAGPATPVEILGLSEVPGAGDPMHAVKDPKKAQEIAESRKGKMAKSLIPATAKVSLEELSKRIAETGQQELRVIIKGDVQGSVEAIADALSKLSGEKVRLSIIHAGVGAITEGDINLAIAAKAVVIGFNVRPAGKATSLAEENKIEIRLYSIIYNAVDDVKAAMEGLLPPTLVEKEHGKAEVRATFKVKGQMVAGCAVTQGKIVRSAKVRVIRDGVVIWDGKIASLRRFKDDAREVAEGLECGIGFEGYSDVREKDVIECYEIEEIKQKL